MKFVVLKKRSTTCMTSLPFVCVADIFFIPVYGNEYLSLRLSEVSEGTDRARRVVVNLFSANNPFNVTLKTLKKEMDFDVAFLEGNEESVLSDVTNRCMSIHALEIDGSSYDLRVKVDIGEGHLFALSISASNAPKLFCPMKSDENPWMIGSFAARTRVFAMSPLDICLWNFYQLPLPNGKVSSSAGIFNKELWSMPTSIFTLYGNVFFEIDSVRLDGSDRNFTVSFENMSNITSSSDANEVSSSTFQIEAAPWNLPDVTVCYFFFKSCIVFILNRHNA